MQYEKTNDGILVITRTFISTEELSRQKKKAEDRLKEIDDALMASK